jgi:hypothetical protein
MVVPRFQPFRRRTEGCDELGVEMVEIAADPCAEGMEAWGRRLLRVLGLRCGALSKDGLGPEGLLPLWA